MRSRSPLYLVMTAVLVLAGCSREPGPMPVLGTPQSIQPPAAEGSSTPYLQAAQDGRLLLSWQERTEDQGTRFAFASWMNGAWTPDRTIAEGPDFFVNWADVPSIHAAEKGVLAAHWLQKSGAGTYAYDVKVRLSADDGATWSESIAPHTDGTPTEHGFATFFDDPQGGVGLVWLDGRETGGMEGHGGMEAQAGAMTLRYGRMDASGRVAEERLLDPRVCDCCPTTAVRVGDAVLVAYRDRSSEEIRDISILRYEDGVWSEPMTVHRDGWMIPGCPVNGPALAARGDRVVLTWYTAEGDTARALAAFSGDAGRTWSAPVLVDEDLTLGRVDAVLLADGTAVVSYMVYVEGEGALRLRTLRADGSRGEPMVLTGISPSRSSGVPRLVRLSEDRLAAAWTEAGTPSRVRAAIIPVGDGTE